MFRKSIAFVAACAAAATLATSANANNRPVSAADAALAAEEVLGLSSSEAVMLEHPETPGNSFTFMLPVDGVIHEVNVWPHSVRTDNYTVLVQGKGGLIKEATPGVENTYRGEVVGRKGSIAALSLFDEGLMGVVKFGDGTERWIEPIALHIPGAPAGLHITYDSSAAQVEGTCGTTPNMKASVEQFGEPDPLAGAANYCAEIAIDADYQFYQDYGNSVNNVENRINSVFNTVNLVYTNQVDITHFIVTILVRTSAADNPYTTNDASSLLNQLRSQWISNHAGIQRDVVQLFTGRSLNGGTIGIAYLSAICTSLAYGLVENINPISCATDLSAHELGHNWGSPHCTCPSTTMNPSLTCANTFAATSQNSITNYRNSISFCLAVCEEPPPPGYCPAEGTNTNAEHITRLEISNINNTSASDGYSDYTDQTGILVELTQYTVTIEMANSDAATRGGIWIDWNQDEDFNDPAEQITDDLAGAGPYVHTFTVPGNVPNGPTRLRVRVQDGVADPDPDACGATTRGEVEDYSVNPVSDPPPANDFCADATVVEFGATAFTTIGATTDGPDEPFFCDNAGETNIDNDVWFRVIAPCTTIAQISICDADFDTRLAIYPGDECPTISNQQITACNDDACGNGSILADIVLLEGNEYLIRAGGYAGATGDGTLDISVAPACPDPNDCPADLNGSGAVDFDDLVQLLAAWGPCGTCPEDIDNNGEVAFNDLVEMLAAWGLCP